MTPLELERSPAPATATDSAVRSDSPVRSRAWLWVVAFTAACLLGFAFQGSRGPWEPDEGFYASPALEMWRR
jgi:hypothetical protein